MTAAKRLQMVRFGANAAHSRPGGRSTGAASPSVVDVRHRGRICRLLHAASSKRSHAAGATLLVARGVQFIALALMFVVAFKRPFDVPARIGGWLLATFAVFSINPPYQIAATWRALPALLGVPLWLPFASSLAVAAVL